MIKGIHYSLSELAFFDILTEECKLSIQQIINSNSEICKNTYKNTILLEAHTGIVMVDVFSTLPLSRSYIDFKYFPWMPPQAMKVHGSR